MENQRIPVLPGALLVAVVMMLSGRLFDKYDAKKIIIPDSLGTAVLIIIMTNVQNLNAPSQALALKNAELYKSSSQNSVFQK